jgi:putative FmdB family regulatory protein
MTILCKFEDFPSPSWNDMPIYEFYCESCNTIFSFFSRRIDTETVPGCPRCDATQLSRQVSMFATIGRAQEDEDQLAGLDETKMEAAMESLMRESESMDENDPKQMAALMRSFSERTGINLGDTMEEAIARLENGEDPEQVEQDMGDLMEGDELDFSLLHKKARTAPAPPRRDETLYDLHPDSGSHR